MTRPPEAEEIVTVTQLSKTFRLWAFILLAALLPASAMAAPFAAYIIDARNGQPVYEQNAHTKLHPASLTKMMTLYMAFAAVESGAVRLDSKFTISSNAANEVPSKLGLRAGQQIELRYLIRAAAVKSANDAATAIGEGIAGSEEEFTRQMTSMARALGMKNTQFRNANGLTESGHYSTAYDMTLLGRRLFYDFPQYYNLFSRRTADAGIATVRATNRHFLNDYSGADGIKTGYTRAAGFNLTASAKRGNKRLIGTVFGGTSTAQRNQVMAQLLDTGFSRVPERVQIAALPPRPALKARVVRRAQVTPTKAATQPKPEELVLASSLPPASRAQLNSQTASLVSSKQIDTVLKQAMQEAGHGTSGRLTTSSRPIARPSTQLAEAVTAVETVSDEAVGSASIANAVLTKSSRPAPSPRARSANAGNASTAALLAEKVVAERAEASTDQAALTLQASAAPEPRSETVILAAMGEGDRSEPEPVRFVSRPDNTSKSWGVSLGLQTSEASASSLLMQTALRGGSTLTNTSRRVANTKQGFRPYLENLTKAQAQLTCERLQSQQQECSVIGG